MGSCAANPLPWPSLDAFREWLSIAPPETTLAASAVHATLAALASTSPAERSTPLADTTEQTWRERLWMVPPETRLGVPEAAEAIGRPVSWVYRHTGEKSIDRMPHRKLDGELVFVASELRAWLRTAEETVVTGASDGAPRSLRRV